MNFSTTWIFVFAIIGGFVAAWRIWQNLRKLQQRQNDSWDARLIDQLRKRGSDPFKPHDVDFFLAFPTQDAAERLAARLRNEGFDADVVDEPESGALRYSLHAHKSMQLTVPDMQELSRRLTDQAKEMGGRYDGWSAKQVPREGPPA
ncbi:MAG TPA: ribonuclease E inhibitor RraB [Steroidobacteraceae bacterium]|nr:ribonuclease E inhibitor RraB [Steroidobacteraceae bacterium]